MDANAFNPSLDPAALEDSFPDLPTPAPPPVSPSQATAAAGSRAPGIAALHDVPVRVQAVLGGARIQIAELLEMRAGSVVELDRRVGEPVDVLVNERLIARGELVLVDGALGITLTEIVRNGR